MTDLIVVMAVAALTSALLLIPVQTVDKSGEATVVVGLTSIVATIAMVVTILIAYGV